MRNTQTGSTRYAHSPTKSASAYCPSFLQRPDSTLLLVKPNENPNATCTPACGLTTLLLSNVLQPEHNPDEPQHIVIVIHYLAHDGAEGLQCVRQAHPQAVRP